jgi:hypothetical protein
MREIEQFFEHHRPHWPHHRGHQNEPNLLKEIDMSTPTPTFPDGWTPSTDASGNPTVTAPDGNPAAGDVYAAVVSGLQAASDLATATANLAAAQTENTDLQSQITTLKGDVATLQAELDAKNGTGPTQADFDALKPLSRRFLLLLRRTLPISLHCKLRSLPCLLMLHRASLHLSKILRHCERNSALRRRLCSMSW